MKRNALALAAVVVGASTFAAFSAHALPVAVGYSLTAAPVAPGGVTTLASGNGNAGIDGATVGSFNISLSAAGTPPFTAPNFGSNTLTVSSGGAGSITLYASETGITFAPPSITSGFSNNPLSNTSVTERTFVGANTLYDTTFQLASTTLAPGGTTSSTNTLPGALPSTYATTETFSITFGAGGGTVNATILDIANNVPEPVSLSILGVGLAGLGFARRFRRG